MSYYIKNGNTEQLINKLDEVLAGNFSFTTILGDAGCGKSFLLETNRSFFELNSHFVGYKSNKLSMGSFNSLEGMLNAITNYIYTLPPEDYKQIKNRLINEHMVHYEILSSFSPIFAKLISKRVVRGQISIKKENLISVMFQLMETLSEVLYPLVLFFDDIQWMDFESINFLEFLEKNNTNIYVVLAARKNELTQHIQNTVFLNESSLIRLEPLTKEDTFTLIVKMINSPQNKFFSDTVYLLTGGIPFYIDFVINRLMEEHPNRDEYSVADLNSIEFYTDNSNVLFSQLNRLTTTEMEALSIFACVDRGLEEDLISKVGIDESIVLELRKKSLLTKIGTKLFVVHDIVKYTVYDILSEHQIKKNYYLLLKALFDMELENSFYVYLITRSNINDILFERTEDYLRSVIAEAIINREKGNIEQSLSLLKFAAKLQAKVRNRDLDYIIQINTMECEYINQNVFYAQALYNELLREFPENSSETKMNYIRFYAFNAEWEKVLELGTELLNVLGFPLNKWNQLIDIVSYKFLYSKKRIDSLDILTRVVDPYIFDVLEVLTIMIPAANRIDIDTFNKVALKLAVLVAKYGYSEYSCIGYSMASLIQYFVFHNIERGDVIQQKIISILEIKDDQFKTIPYALLGTFTHHWNNPFSDTLLLLQKSYENSGKDNEFLFSNYALVFNVITQYVNGSTLDQIQHYMNGFTRETSRLEDFLLKHMFDLYTTQLKYLKDGKIEYEFSPEYRNSFDETIILNHKMLQVHQLYLERKFEEAYQLCEEIDSLVWAHDGFVLNGHFAFYSCLVRVQYLHNCNNKEKEEKKIEKLLQFMSQWSQGKNLDHVIQYKVALLVWNLKKGKHVEEIVNDLSDLVLKTVNKPLRAVVHLMLAKYYHNFREVKEMFKKKAYNDFILWGATYIAGLYAVEEVKKEKEVPRLKEINKYINMSNLEVTKYYVDYLFNTSSVTEVGLCSEKDDNLYLQYKFDGEAKEFDNLNISMAKDIPQKELRFVFRSGEELYKNQLFCMPLKENDVLSGAVYLKMKNEDDIPFVRNIISTYLPIKSKKKVKVVKLEEALTKREIEILQLVSMGYSNEDISKKAFVTIGTIRNHLSSVYRKLAVSNRVQAIITAKELGVIE